jgi:seryl-tRNA synthetase
MDLNQRIQEVQHAHEQLQADNLNLRARIDDLSNRGDDKMLLIKLQNEVNFLKNKLADQLQTILEKEGELETAAL